MVHDTTVAVELRDQRNVNGKFDPSSEENLLIHFTLIRLNEACTLAAAEPTSHLWLNPLRKADTYLVGYKARCEESTL